MFRPSPNQPKIDPKTQSKRASPKSDQKSDFLSDFGSILGGFWHQKSKKVAKSRDDFFSRISRAKKLRQYGASAEVAMPIQLKLTWEASGGEGQKGDLDACRSAGGRAHCLRFANPAEANWRPEDGRLRP